MDHCKYPMKCMQAGHCMEHVMDSPDKPPASWEELCDRQVRNYEVKGYGIEGMRIHLPCLFCGAPDFIVHTITETDEAYAQGAVCKECARGARIPQQRKEHAHGVDITIAFEQTVGPDLPPWYKLSVPRVRTN